MRASDGPGKSCSRALQLVLRSTSGALAKFLGLNQLRDEGRYLKGMAPPHSAISATVPGQIGRGLRQCVYTRVSETLGPKREVIYSWQGRVGIMIALALSCPRSRQRLGGVRWKMKGGGEHKQRSKPPVITVITLIAIAATNAHEAMKDPATPVNHR